jgi:hypothetical protein
MVGGELITDRTYSALGYFFSGGKATLDLLIQADIFVGINIWGLSVKIGC